MKWSNRLGKWLRFGGVCSGTALLLGATSVGCLSRPVGTQPPTTKVNFTNTVSQQAVDKIDLLFAIDNSASMGDKQTLLALAVPQLLRGLLNPKCVKEGVPATSGKLRADPNGDTTNHFGCDSGYDPEFKPVTDMHIGVISSSLGNFGGDVCDTSKERTNDKAHLLTGNVAAAKSGFLAWFPDTKENDDKKRHPVPADPVKTGANLEDNFAEMVKAVGQDGCGLEAQLESVYRFLIQPDPWEKVEVPDNKKATLGNGVDFTVLKQRADFLRPDSLVAVIMLTDEDDSSADPLAVNGQGWAFMNNSFPGSTVQRSGGSSAGRTAPRGTSICETDPGSKDCTSCAFAKDDPSCKENGGFYGPSDDELNVRFHHMKQRYGVDPQYPIKRYVDGFTKLKVPDRETEHVIHDGVIDPYTYVGKCTNPLFALNLPKEAQNTAELCNLQPGARSPDLVFFAVVGGVPWQLLHFNPDSPEESQIKNEDWVKILGQDPLNFNYDGIDPHMIQSVEPRTKEGLTGADAARGDNGTDKYNGREWDTKKNDLQYACTFELPAALDPGNGGPTINLQRDCPPTSDSCDCSDPGSNAPNPPLCDSGTKQIRAKAYPTIREFEVVRALGNQGIVASLCPQQLDKPGTLEDPNPTFGYNPAVAAIIDRLKNALTSQCLPQRLRTSPECGAEPTDKDEVPCLVLAQLSDKDDKCSNYAEDGLQEVENQAVLKVFKAQQKAESGNISAGGVDLSLLPVCQLKQKVVGAGESCKDEAEMVWCYVEKACNASPAGPNCPQGLIFSSGTQKLPNAKFSLQCINQFKAGVAAGDEE